MSGADVNVTPSQPCEPCSRLLHGRCERGLLAAPGTLCACWCRGERWEGLPPPAEHPIDWQPPPPPREPCHGCARQPGERRVAHARWCERGGGSCDRLPPAKPLPGRRETPEERRHGDGRTNPRKRKT